MVRCKFVCQSKMISGSGENQTVEYKFSAVTSGSHENKSFWKWTPTGNLQFSCLNPNVEFEIGKEYYLDLSLAE